MGCRGPPDNSVLALVRLWQSRPRSRSRCGRTFPCRRLCAGRRGCRARRRAAADRAVRRVLRAGRGRHRFAARPADGPFGRLDDDPARCRPGASGICDALPLLSGARLAERRRRARRAVALCDRPDRRRIRRFVEDARVQLPAAGLRRAGAWRRLCRLAARPHHRRPAAADHGGRGFVLRADRRCDAGPSRDAWRCHRYAGADACRTVDLYADRARRQRHPDRAGRPLAEPGLPHRFDGDRPGFGGDGA